MKEDIKSKVEKILNGWRDITHTEFANRELLKMYLKYGNKDISVEELRLIVYNLMLSDIELNNGKCTENTKRYSKLLKDRMEESNYMNVDLEHKKKYCRVLNSYRDSYRSTLNKEEIHKINKYVYDTFKKYTVYDGLEVLDYSDMLIAKFNLALEIKDFISLNNILDEIRLHKDNTDIKLIYNQLRALL